jgi:large subunit ribosomal protein L25
MKSVPLKAFPRSLTRRSGSAKLRASGRVPAVIYGGQTKPQALEIQTRDLENLVNHSVSENLLVDLSVSEDQRPKRLVLLQEIQHHPLSGAFLHVDFHEVAEDEKVTITVPVETVGEPAGVKTGGGILEHVLFKIKVRALPKDLPEFIQIDVNHLELGQSIHLGEIKPPEGTEILGDKHITVVSVAAPRTEAQEEATLAGAPAGELEVIKEKKDETAGGEAKGGGDKAGAKGGEKPAEKAAEKKPKK